MKESVQLTMTLFAADVCGKYTNCDYPNEIKVTDEESLIQAVSGITSALNLQTTGEA